MPVVTSIGGRGDGAAVDDGPCVDGELMPQRQVLEDEIAAGADRCEECCDKQTEVEGSVRSQGASTLRRHKATSLVVYAAASSLISECQRVRKSRRCSVNATWAPPRRRTRKYCRSSSNALQKRDADSKLPKPCIG